MTDLKTVMTNLYSIRTNLRATLHKNPSSDLAVSLVKLNAVIVELESLITKIEISVKDGKVTWVDIKGDSLPEDKRTELNLAIRKILG